MNLFNIESATTTTLFAIHGSSGSINSIRLTNTHGSTSVEVQLYLEDSAAAKTYLAKTDIPGNTTLLLDGDVSFNNRIYALKIETSAGGLSSSTPLSVIIK